MTTVDTSLEKVIELTGRIQKEITKDEGKTCTFVHDEKTNGVKVFTYNDKSRTSFLLLNIPAATTKEAALEAVLDYLQNHTKKTLSYTVTWMRKGSAGSGTHKSFFHVSNLRDLAEKFYSEPPRDGIPSQADNKKDPDEYVVLEVHLNGEA